MRVVVTGGSGKAGRAVVRELLEHGHRVRNADLVPDPHPVCEYRHVNLAELGQAYEVLGSADAVVHLAAIPRPGFLTEEATFRTNMATTFNWSALPARSGSRRWSGRPVRPRSRSHSTTPSRIFR